MMAFSRYMRNMKTALLVPFLLVAPAWADETADRASIARTIAALNDPGQRAGVFAKGANPVTELFRLLTFDSRPTVVISHELPRFTVVISHEPWGEATIEPAPSGFAPAVPQIESGPIQFLNPDVALVEGTARPADRILSTPVLFVMLREGPDWKIGSLRVLKPGTAETPPWK
jgi:hypothetical protein